MHERTQEPHIGRKGMLGDEIPVAVMPRSLQLRIELDPRPSLGVKVYVASATDQPLYHLGSIITFIMITSSTSEM
jgi:hypothetical protein